MSTRFTETLNSVASEFGVEPDSNPHREPRQSKWPYFRWTAEMTEKLVDLVDQQKNAEEIAVALCVPVDRVKIKLAALKAKVPSVKPSKANSKSELNAPEAPESEPEPPTNIDRIIFAAFNEFVGLVDDFDRTADCWRQAMHTIEQHLSGCVTLVREHPETEPHLCKIAAIIAYDEIMA